VAMIPDHPAASKPPSGNSAVWVGRAEASHQAIWTGESMTVARKVAAYESTLANTTVIDSLP
jgi:hypothetical protein